MSLSLQTRSLIIGFSALTLLAFSPFPTAGAAAGLQSDGSELSDPPQMALAYQTRAPRLCKDVTAPPSSGQAAVMVQCELDRESPVGLFLMQEVAVQMSPSRSYVVDIDGELKEIDPKAPVYPLTGSLKAYWCSPVGVGYPAGKNCTLSPMPAAAGSCWRTTFGDWKCSLKGPTPNSRTGMPGPTIY